MPTTNDFKPFAGDVGALVMSQPDYVSAAAFRGAGFPAGMVTKESLNKVLRQATAVSAAIAEVARQVTNTDVLDDGNSTNLVNTFLAAFGGKGSNTVVGAVNDVAALRLLGTVSYKVMNTAYYATVGDGGGAQYWKDTGDTTSPDDGATVIVTGLGVRWKLMLKDTMRAECFGVVSNGTDTSTAMQLAINSGKSIALSAGKTYTCKNINSVNGGALVCAYGRATVNVVAGAGNYGVLINTSNFMIYGIKFVGGNNGPYNSGTGTFGTRNGVIIGNNYGTGVSLNNITVSNCEFTGFDVCGVQGREVQIGFTFDKKVFLQDIDCHHNLIGIWASQRFEYYEAVGCWTHQNFAGVISTGGNHTWLGLKSQDNKQNLQLAIGENDHHGQFIGGDLNHAYTGGWGLYAEDVTNGEFITSMGMWYSPIFLKNCTGVFISKCQIVGAPYVTVDGGGINSISDNWTPTPLVKTIVTPVHFTRFLRNLTTSTDTSQATHYGQVAMRSTNTTGGALALPLVFSSLSDFELPLSYTLKKWQGEDAAFLQTSGRIYIPATQRYRFIFSIRFAVGAVNEKVSIKVVRFDSGGSPQDFEEDCREFTAAATNCVCRLTAEFYCVSGDTIGVFAQTKTATGVTITALKHVVQSVDE